MRLLLISNSTNAGEAYLEYPKQNIQNFLDNNIKKVLFIPYAGVTFSFDAYVEKVQMQFSTIGYEVIGIHTFENKIQAVKDAEAIVVGGGSTWQLLTLMQKENIIDAIREKVLSGTPYIGWSAGSNVACPTIKTTNDMPIMQPESFNACNLVPFQINPHYLDANPEGHAGETREERINEFLQVNQNITVLGLREGCMLQIENNQMNLIGNKSLRIFKYGTSPIEASSSDNLNHLLER